MPCPCTYMEDVARNMKVLILLACAVAYVASDATSDCKAASDDCSAFFDCCGSCNGGWSAYCGGSAGSWSSSTKCSCDKWGGVDEPDSQTSSDATSDCKAASADCSAFFDCCGSCNGGWSANCGGSAGSWSSSTKCSCDKWGGVQEPKVEQDDATFSEDAYKTHNTLRAKHGASALKVDADAQSTAQKWAKYLASSDTFNHNSDRGNFGENIYYSTGTVEGKDAVNAWYDEVNDPGYDFNNQGFSSGTGHFTQVVWKGTTGIGCGRGTSSSGRTYVVCNYSPPGNMRGDFEDNVSPASRR